MAVVERLQVLTDDDWALIVPHLPARTKDNWLGRGRAWGDHRPALEGIIWRFRTGSPWRDLPAEYGAWQTVYRRFNTWSKDGTFNRILTAIQAQAHAEDQIDWAVSVDSSNARAHKHAAGALARPEHATGGISELQEICRRAC